LGTVLKQQGKLPESATGCARRCVWNRIFAGAHTTLATVLKQLGDADGAAAEARAGSGTRETQDRFAGGAVCNEFRQAAAKRRDLEGAVSQFRSAINAAHDFAPAHYELGLALRQQGKKEKRRKNLRKPERWIQSWLLRTIELSYFCSFRSATSSDSTGTPLAHFDANDRSNGDN